MSRTPRHPAPAPLRLLRYLRLGIHLLNGLLTVALCFPLASSRTRGYLRQCWSRNLLAILGVQLEVRGEPVTPGALLVANHISWLDIFVVNALQPVAFVSKAEVRDWPAIGWLAAASDTVFLRRGSRGHAKIINAEIAALLDQGRHVAVFPEGTTTDGTHVLHFHAALLQPALDACHPVQPLALSYRTPDGVRSLSPAYDGDVTLGECLSSIIGERRLIACIAATPALDSVGTNRKVMAESARAAIEGSLAAGPGALATTLLRPAQTGEDDLHDESGSLDETGIHRA